MREILFRAKSKVKGNWLYGYLGNSYNTFYISDGESDSIAINLETLGQFTGLTDKNGKKIFEGDIVKLTDTVSGFKTRCVVKFENPNGTYNWGYQLEPLEYEPFNNDILLWVDMEKSGAYIEVIGNIYDNPELLEVKDNV